MARRPGLDRDTVVAAAARLVNREGADALTLGRLASDLGVQPPSLYNHVEGLPGLLRELALMNARSLGDRMIDAALGKSGADAVRSVAQAMRSYIKENPGVYLSSLRASRNLPAFDAALAAAEDHAVRVVVAVLAAFNLEGDDTIHAVRGMRSLVHGFATLEIAGGFGLSLDCDESFRRLVETWIQGLPGQ